MKTYTNIKPKFANEFLADIFKAEGDQRLKLLREYGNMPPLNYLLVMNFDDRIKLDLPEGMPVYDKNMADHPDTYTPLASMIRRIKNCTVDMPIKKMKKEMIFIEILGAINIQEGEILCAAKDRQLQELYPDLSVELMREAIPNFVHP